MSNDKIPTQNYSIKTRLTIFYGLTTMILLVITALFFYLTTMHILHKANQQFLADETSVLGRLLEHQPDNLLALKQEVIENSYIEPGSEYRFYVRMLDEKNHVILQTPNFGMALDNAPYFKTSSSKKKVVHWNSPDNQFVLMQVKSLLGKTQKPVTIQVALDITYQQSVINYYSKILAATLLTIMLISIVLGYIISNRATRSLKRLTEATRQITASSLHQRIDPKRWPKELHSLGIAFNEMLARIENAVTNLTQFSGDLAHELRTPVNNLMGEAEIVLSRTHTTEQYREVLISHLEELQRLAHMIENILFLARTENPKLDIKKEQVNIANEMTLICEFYQAMADEKNIRITREGTATLSVNKIMFERMLSNLLSNALKYTPENGTIQLIAKQENQVVEIILQDSGIGIEAKHIPKLFQRFYRIDSARARSAGGVGLGLPIVKSIVELHHGTITIMSEPEKGTRVVLIFPGA